MSDIFDNAFSRGRRRKGPIRPEKPDGGGWFAMADFVGLMADYYSYKCLILGALAAKCGPEIWGEAYWSFNPGQQVYSDQNFNAVIEQFGEDILDHEEAWAVEMDSEEFQTYLYQVDYNSLVDPAYSDTVLQVLDPLEELFVQGRDAYSKYEFWTMMSYVFFF